MAIEYKRLAVLSPADTTEAELYEIPASSEIIATLMIANISSGALTFRVAHTDGAGAAAAEDWIAYDEAIAANSRVSIPIVAQASEYIRVQSSSGDDITFILSGMLKT